jgi:glycosyltransferase involved in cell wall biosynthesis
MPEQRAALGRRTQTIEPEAGGQPLPTGVHVIVPAFNEGTAIALVIRDLLQMSVQVVVVDDGSTDNTADVARQAGATVVSHALNRGQGAALQTGIEFCVSRGAAYLVTFDADGQHLPTDVPTLIEPIARGEVDVVLGSRFLGTAENIELSRKLVLKLGIAFTRLFSGARLTDTHNGIRAFSLAAARRIHLTQDRMAHASQIIDQIVSEGLRYREVPVAVRYTEYSTSKGQTTGSAFRIALDYFLGRVAR